MVRTLVTAALTAACVQGAVTYGQPEPGELSADGIFEKAIVIDVGIEVADAQMAALREDHRGYVPCVLRLDGEVLRNAGVRLKGSAGSFRPIDGDKPGFTLKLNQFQPKARFRGLRKLVLNNCVQDPSYLSEVVGNEIFRRAGIPAVRGTYARVKLNGKDLGVYVLFEAASRDFLARHFASGDGNLYEGPGDVNGEIDTDRDGPQPDQRDLRMLANAASEPNPRERMRRLREVLELERFAAFLALEAVLWHWDGYCVGVNNYRIYSDPSTGRMVFLPHGSDQLFQSLDGPLVPESQGLVARAVLSTIEGQQLYRAKLKDLAGSALDPDWISARVELLSSRVQEALAKRSESEARDYRSAADQFLQQALERIRHVRNELEANESLFGTPLEFDDKGVARLTGWRPRIESGAPELTGGRDSRWLRIQAGDEGHCVASWRTKVLLAPGRYAFVGRARLRNVAPLDPGDVEEGRESGVSLRISRHQPRTKLTGTRSDVELAYEFQVTRAGIGEEPGEPEDAELPAAGDAPLAVEVQLVCELEAESGELEVDAESLRLISRSARL